MMIQDKLKNYNIILASASPRRRELLENTGIHFTVTTVDCEEEYPMSLKNSDIAEFLAAAKADAYTGILNEKDILVTADTIVWCKETLLGKPKDYNEAFRFLRLLSGCDHEVITGISLRSAIKRDIFSIKTCVTFRNLEDDEIDYYVRNFSPYDKAGAYGIQEWIGLTGITSISGSYYNVVGLPTGDLLDHLQQFIDNK
jgi:septum formation protein